MCFHRCVAGNFEYADCLDLAVCEFRRGQPGARENGPRGVFSIDGVILPARRRRPFLGGRATS